MGAAVSDVGAAVGDVGAAVGEVGFFVGAAGLAVGGGVGLTIMVSMSLSTACRAQHNSLLAVGLALSCMGTGVHSRIIFRML